MTRANGGVLTLAALAKLHAPKTAEELRVACRELRGRGYSDHGIAAVTALTVEAVRRLLGEVAT